MPGSTKRKLFYNLDEIAARLDLSLIEIGVLLAEGQMRLCTPVAGLPVEFGIWENRDEPDRYGVPQECRVLKGLVDLRSEDSWAVLRNGSSVVSWLHAEPPGYLKIGGGQLRHPGIEITRNDVGVLPAEMRRLQKRFGAVSVGPLPALLPPPPRRPRGAHPTHDWEACQLEVFRLFYFEGVPESKAALIRHVQKWFRDQGRKVPDESTLQRRLKDIWTMFAPEARRKTA